MNGVSISDSPPVAPRRILIMGSPGVGKGTQAARLGVRLRIPSLSTGELFRQNVEEETAIGLEVKALIESGRYVADSIVDQLVADRLAQPDAASGFILDGYPRTVGQSAALDAVLGLAGYEIEAVLVLDAPDGAIAERLIARAGIEQRQDDTPEVIRVRLEEYARQTEPILAGYESRGILHRIPGDGTPGEVAARIGQRLRA